MKRDPLVYGIIGSLIGGAVVWALISVLANTNNVDMMRMVGMRYGNQQIMQSNTMDAHFIEQMIPHHEDAITMGKLAQTKAKTQEVKQLAEDIIISQGKEIEQMKSWYKEWFKREIPTGDEVMNQHGMTSDEGSMHMGMMGTQSDVTKLETAESFDRAFIEHMIPHHQMAVMMASMLKNGTKRSEMKQLADDIIKAQTKEIEEMRQWLEDWNSEK